MRIAIIIDGLGGGGAEKQVLLAAAEIMRLGAEVDVITYHPGNRHEEFVRQRGISVWEVGGVGPLRIARILGIARILRKGEFDVVHAFKGCSSFYGRLAGKLAGVRCIFGGYRCLDAPSRLQRLIHGILARNTAGWIVNSEWVRKAVCDGFGAAPETVHVVANGIVAGDYQSELTPAEAKSGLGLPADARVVTIVAQFRPEKNHAMFLRVARRLVDAGSGAAFLAAGDGPMQEEMRRLASRLGLDRHIRFPGRCENVSDLLRATDVCVLTSPTEGSPNALLEAAAAGIPCVSTDNGGAADIVQNGKSGFLVSLDDDGAMADRILGLLDDPESCGRMGRAASALVAERFSAERLGARLLEVYSKGVARGEGGGSAATNEPSG